jgi:glycosyltransferase involved in cell wall biosynthesis
MTTSAPSGRPRCVIFFYEGYLNVSPTNVNLAKALARAGYDVTIYTVPHDASDAGALGPVKVRRFEAGSLGARIGALGAGRFRLGRIVRRLVPGSVPALYALRTLVSELRARVSDDARTVYVGVDLEGGMAAALSAALLGRRFVYVSLELRLTPTQKEGVRGALGRLAYRRSAAVLAQGADRFDLIARELRWRHPTELILPNSPFADDAAALSRGDNYFRNRFGIGARQRIALQAGMINDITCCSALAKGFAPVPGWALVLHERMKRDPNDPYLAALARSNGRNLYLSLDPLPYDQIDRVFAAADVGLAFYEPENPDDENFRSISSSGKLPHYLKFGKPLLVSALPSLVEIVERHGCGLAVKNPADSDELGAALEQIASRYDEFSRNAVRCFAERYEFGKGAEPVIRFLDRL